jgi:hypothetical protein
LNDSVTKGIKQDFIAAVAEARHASLRLNRIQILRQDVRCGWAPQADLKGMEFVGVKQV